jgi:hypothetical protein
MYRKCSSYSDQSRCVHELAEAAHALLRRFNYSDPDARTVALNNVHLIARGSQLTLNLLDSWVKGDEAIRQVIPQLLGISQPTVDSVRLAGDLLGKNGKLALAVLAQFQIENLLRNLHRELSLGSAPAGFYRCAANVLNHLGISLDRLETLNVAARIRNSLHSNGVHHRQHPNEQPMVTLHGVAFEFKDGQKVECASWEHIAHALECSVAVVGDILSHPQVSSLPDPMLDVYAWDQATAP